LLLWVLTVNPAKRSQQYSCKAWMLGCLEISSILWITPTPIQAQSMVKIYTNYFARMYHKSPVVQFPIESLMHMETHEHNLHLPHSYQHSGHLSPTRITH
jgi:hypothetical protein